MSSKHSWLLEYYNKSLTGEIILGNELKTCLKNLIEDLSDDKFIYDTKGADLRIEFIETFCKHTKSPFNGMPFLLELWEKAVIEAFYSFKWKDTKLRRFKKLILLVARKNGKSTFCAALCFTEFMIGNAGSDIICSSNDDAQAGLIFDEINNMREMFDKKSKRTHKNLKGIFNLKNKSTIKKLSDKTRNKEGRNIELAILDESHEMKDNVIAKSIEQSQSIKDEPMFINITTEGFVDDGYLDKELIYARKVLKREIEDYTLLPWLYTQDNETEVYQDEKSWFKANPSLGTVKKISYLRDQLKKAQHDKAERVFTLSKDFNFKQNSSQAWLMEKDIINDLTYNIEDFIGSIGIGAVDLSETTDLSSAKVLIKKPNDNTKYILQKYFIPESKVEEGSEEDKKNYLEWAKEGLIHICRGNEVDYSDIVMWFVSLYKKYNIRLFKIGYDKWNAKSFVKEMEDYGFELEKIGQDFNNLSTPMKLVEADLKSNLINYNKNPIDIWCLKNTVAKVNQYGQIMPIKPNDTGTQRIDGAVTLIILYATYDRFRREYLEIVR
ncbi:terminase large subunit [Clostridium sporogenes]|uniref:Terminase large subunit n=1 Tax=Clostridium sporogenes TaxID=1509 RepID=A0AAE4FN63_CLOSG|nr:terminase TerL endonuclease subunit [Clostridium sporogenes]MDS1005306.1 terminase large subunit [Clostridium sporogenes]